MATPITTTSSGKMIAPYANRKPCAPEGAAVPDPVHHHSRQETEDGRQDPQAGDSWPDRCAIGAEQRSAVRERRHDPPQEERHPSCPACSDCR